MIVIIAGVAILAFLIGVCAAGSILARAQRQYVKAIIPAKSHSPESDDPVSDEVPPHVPEETLRKHSTWHADGKKPDQANKTKKT